MTPAEVTAKNQPATNRQWVSRADARQSCTYIAKMWEICNCPTVLKQCDVTDFDTVQFIDGLMSSPG